LEKKCEKLDLVLSSADVKPMSDILFDGHASLGPPYTGVRRYSVGRTKRSVSVSNEKMADVKTKPEKFHCNTISISIECNLFA